MGEGTHPLNFYEYDIEGVANRRSRRWVPFDLVMKREVRSSAAGHSKVSPLDI